LSGVQGDASLKEVIERKATRAGAADSGTAVLFWVVAGMPRAFALHPLGDLQFVGELQHHILL
jgi:hypothetical protein